ncbi:MAG: GNAT family acetyltransferase [Deltaproteobacteria bacterium]|nr:MAG: GNAT family acetyltransferase [Deltaproteobacteria bacterium]
MDNLTIRIYDLRDQEAVIRLWNSCGLIVPANDPIRDIARKIRFQKELFLVAVRRGQIVGTVMAGYEGRRGWINCLAVSPVLQRKGLGRRLMQEAEKRLLALGCPKVNLLVRTSNSQVIEFYRKLGFAREDVVSLGKRFLVDPLDQQDTYVIRPPRPGDLGQVVHLHGALYAEEYHWDEQFEGLVADIVAKFIRDHDPKRERCWIAESNKEIIGSVFLVKKSVTVAKLRLLIVEPKARGLGVGTRLVDECLRFARQAGYRKIKLWTNDVLHAARHIYKKAGFRLVHQEPHHSFGHDLIGETWELRL